MPICNLNTIIQFYNEHKDIIHSIYLTGSSALNMNDEKSDIDIELVLFDTGLGNNKNWEIENNILPILPRDQKYDYLISFSNRQTNHLMGYFNIKICGDYDIPPYDLYKIEHIKNNLNIMCRVINYNDKYYKFNYHAYLLSQLYKNIEIDDTIINNCRDIKYNYNLEKYIGEIKEQYNIIKEKYSHLLS